MSIPDFEHVHLTERTAAKLYQHIQVEQMGGFELVSASQANDGSWHAFMKRSVANPPLELAKRLYEMNHGISMLLENHQGLVTTGDLQELRSVVSCILRVLEDDRPTS